MGGKQLSPLAPPAFCYDTLKCVCRTRMSEPVWLTQTMVKYLLIAQVPYGDHPEGPRYLMIIRITKYLSSH